MSLAPRAGWDPGGRSPGWRAATATAGALCLAGGVTLVLAPWLLAWVVAAGLGLVGLLLLVSAVAAKGRGRAGGR